MTEKDSAGVYDWEAGASGITRKPAPTWWAPSIDRRLLRSLMQRKNYRGFLNVGPWLLLLAALGYAAAVTMSSPWCILIFFVYGNVFGNISARWHESLHGTPFRTPVLNEILFFLSSAADFRDTVFTRWSHVTHHSYTIDTEVDLEIHAPRPVKMWKLLLDLFYLVAGYVLIVQLVLHSLGIPTKSARRVVPESEFRRMFWAARGALLLHLAAIALSVILASWLPVLLFTLARFYGGPLLHVFAITQHAGLAENATDHRLVARTVHLNPLFAFLYMQMQYHVEHHVFPGVPFHALGRLHRAVAAQMPPVYRSLWDVYRESIPMLIRQRHDVDACIRRPLPEASPA